MKKAKIKTAHTSSTGKPMGDYYGSGVKNKIGKARQDMMITPLSKKKLKNPPKSLA